MENESSKRQEKSSEMGTEKSPIEPSDYSGLQLDTEAQERGRKDGDQRRNMMKSAAFMQSGRGHFANEKDYEVAGLDEESPPPPAPSYEAPIPKVDDAMKEAIHRQGDRASKKRRLFGMSIKRIIILFTVVLAIIIVAAVVGGVVGSRNAAASSTLPGPPPPLTTTSSVPVVSPTSDPISVNAGLPKSDLMVASPLVPVAFSQNVSGSQTPVQTYWLFFQTVNGNVKQCIRGTGAVNTDWQNANPIFTDAHNYSGLAAINYLNQSQSQLTNSHWPVSGNSSFADDGGWNGFRMAATYSTNFSTGPGARLFYHGSNKTDTWIQELIWYHQNDSWAMGTAIFGADPTSHLAATIEPLSQVLRLFYSSGSGAIEEQWIDITAPNATYQLGVRIPSLLAKTSSDLAAVSTNDSTLLYYASAPNPSANITIRELELSPRPDSAASTSSRLVAMPDLLANDTDRTLPNTFAPLSAVLSTLDGGQTITVMWADGVVDPESGYGALRAVSRSTNASWGDVSYGQAEGMVQVPLGDDNANPS